MITRSFVRTRHKQDRTRDGYLTLSCLHPFLQPLFTHYYIDPQTNTITFSPDRNTQHILIHSYAILLSCQPIHRVVYIVPQVEIWRCPLILTKEKYYLFSNYGMYMTHKRWFLINLEGGPNQAGFRVLVNLFLGQPG